MDARDKQLLAKHVTSAQPSNLAVAYVQPRLGITEKDALESLKRFMAKRGDYILIAVRL